MIVQLKTFKVSCDRCKESVIVQDSCYPDLPTGWSRKEVHDCGMTGYTDEREYCQACTENEAKREPKTPSKAIV